MSVERIQRCLDLMKLLRSSKLHCSPRQVARVTGTLISMNLALGERVRFYTRHLYRFINSCDQWDFHLPLSVEAVGEIDFWLDHLMLLGTRGNL